MAAQRAVCVAATNGKEVRVLLLWSTTSTTSVFSLLQSLGRNCSSEVISLCLED